MKGDGTGPRKNCPKKDGSGAKRPPMTSPGGGRGPKAGRRKRKSR